MTMIKINLKHLNKHKRKTVVEEETKEGTDGEKFIRYPLPP